jgi:hypothetical protein
MKKLLFSVGLLMITSTLSFAVDFTVSAGIAGDLSPIISSIDTDVPEPYKTTIDELADQKISRGGFTVFFDATYIELDLGLQFYNIDIKQTGLNYKEKQTYFNFGLLGKIPFSTSEKFVISPLFGFDYQILTKVKSSFAGVSTTVDRDDLSTAGYDEDYYDRFIIKAGIGVDYYITETFYVRGNFTWDFHINTESQKDITDAVEELGYELNILQHGPAFKLAVGYRF